jgi:NTE family protein
MAGALLLLGSQRRQAVAAALRAAAAQASSGQAAAPATVVRSPELEAALAVCVGGDLAAIVALGRLMSQHPDDGSHAEQARQMVGEDWPSGDLTVVVRSARTGERKTFSGEVSLPLAVAASSAAPGRSRPVVIDGESYIDGAIGSLLNADLAHGARTAWVLAPTGLGSSALEAARMHLRQELAALEALGTRVEVFTPEGDFANLSAFADVGRAMDDGGRVARAWLRRP